VESTDPAGGANGVQVTTGQDVAQLLTILSGQITSSELAASLAAPIAQIPGLVSAGGNRVRNSSFEMDSDGDGLSDRYSTYNNGGITLTQSLVAGRNGGLAQRVNFTGTPNNSTQGLRVLPNGNNPPWEATKSYVVSLYIRADGGQVGRTCNLHWNTAPTSVTVLTNPALSGAFQRYAWRITWGAAVETSGALFVSSSTSGAARNGGLEFDDLQIEEGTTLTSYVPGRDAAAAYAAVQQEIATRTSETGFMSALYTVRVQLTQGGRTVMGGFGVSGTTGGTAGPTIDAGVMANKFWIGAPAGSDVDDVLPFVVQTTDTTVNGVLIPKGVYMDAAFINNLTALWARFGTLVADSIQATAISAAQLTLGDGTIGGILKSANYLPGSSGWIVTTLGFAELNDVIVRGTVYATAGEFSATIRMGSASAYDAGLGLWQGFDPDTEQYVWRVGDPAGNRAQWDGNTFAIFVTGSSVPLLSAGGITASTGQLIVNTPQLSINGAGDVVMSGTLAGAVGTFSGTLSAGTVTPTAFEAIVFEFAAEGTWNLNAPTKRPGWAALAVRMTIQAPGGGGGGGYGTGAPNNNPIASGGGGGAGQRVIYTFENVTEGEPLTVTIPPGGAGGAPSQTNSGGAAAGSGGTPAPTTVVRGGVNYAAAPGVGGAGGWRNSDGNHTVGFAVNGGSLGG
ncbi:MAG: DUF1983 domain-containing protein, partial [Rubrivivax sp.]